MREVSIRGFRKNMARELCDLPFVLTKRGVHIATISPANGVHMVAKCTQDTIRTAQQLSHEEFIVVEGTVVSDELGAGKIIPLEDNFFRPMPK